MSEHREIELSHQLLLELDRQSREYVVENAARAMTQLYGILAARGFRLAMGVVRHAPDAEEVIQDVLFALWIGAKRYNPNGQNPFAWFAVVVRNKAIDLLRHRSGLASALGCPVKPPPKQRPSPEDLVAAVQAQTKLRWALERLPSQQRLTLELGNFQGFSHQEIASRTGTPMGTVKSRGRAGLLSLAASLGPDQH